MNAFLFQVTSYHATTKTRTNFQCVASLSRGEIPPHGSDVWSGDQMIIPAIPPSYLVGCSIIDIRYILQVNNCQAYNMQTVVSCFSLIESSQFDIFHSQLFL